MSEYVSLVVSTFNENALFLKLFITNDRAFFIKIEVQTRHY